MSIRSMRAGALAAIPLVVLALNVAHPQSALAAASVSVSPTSGPAGTTIVVSGAGYTPGETVLVRFGGATAGSTPVSVYGTFAMSLQVPAVAVGTYTIQATGQTSNANATTTFQVTAQATPSSPLLLQKLVAVNGVQPSQFATASANDELMYILSFKNTSTSAVSNVTITDTLAAGQTVIAASGVSCTYADASRTVTCTIPSVAAGGTGSFEILTGVNPGFAGTISNTAAISGTGVVSSTSDTTVVTVPATATTAVSGNLYICGTVSTFTAPVGAATGTLQVAGTTFTVASGAIMTGTAIVPGNSYCLTLSSNTAGQVTALDVTPNLPGVAVACGVYQTIVGGLTIGGVPFALPAGMTFPIQLVPGAVYCFLLGPSGTVIGILSGVPTAATAVGAQPVHRVSRNFIEE